MYQTAVIPAVEMDIVIQSKSPTMVTDEEERMIPSPKLTVFIFNTMRFEDPDEPAAEFDIFEVVR